MHENSRSWLSQLQNRWLERRLRRDPNLRGAVAFPPGHFYSPLLDLAAVGTDGKVPFDGAESWEHVDLQSTRQREFYEQLIRAFPPLPFPERQSSGWRYFEDNDWFGCSDAFTLSGILRRSHPRRIVEVGSGFSSAVMLDTLDQTGATAALTFIEPNPQRLEGLLTPADRQRTTILRMAVQEVPFEVFDQLESGDVLFIDSSHVCKIGSDVAHLLLRIVPRLKPGVFVHVHDIFYPYSYPPEWIRQGRAWNESLFLRAFLMGNARLEIVAFNAYAAVAFPEVFRDTFPDFLEQRGSSLWLRMRESAG